MKINIDVDMTPEEARTLLGLPDVQPMQQVMMNEIEDRMRKALTAMEPDAIFKTWLPAGLQSLETWQNFLIGRVGAAMRRGEGEKERSSDKP